MAIESYIAAVARLLVARYGSRARAYAARRAELHTPARQLWMAVVSAIDGGGPGGDDYAMPDGRPVL